MSQFHREHPSEPHPFAHTLRYERDPMQDEIAADDAAKEEAGLRDAFLALALSGDLDAAAPFAAPVLDHRNRTARGIPTRYATLLDVLGDAVDYDDFQRCLFAVLLKAAKVDGDAGELLERMAAKWASMNVEAA